LTDAESDFIIEVVGCILNIQYVVEMSLIHWLKPVVILHTQV